jgi:polar amino acid transport system substrate-binding protein
MEGKVMRKLAVAIVTTILFAFGAAPAFSDKLQDIISSGVVRIGVPLDAPPYGFQDADRNPTGFDVELAQRIAEALGVELEMQQVTGANRIPFLLTNKVDVIISNLGLTPERAKQVLFTSPYSNNYMGVFGREDLSVSNMEELTPYKVATPKGSPGDLLISDKNPSVELLRMEDDASVGAAYISGQADLIVVHDIQAAEIAKRVSNADLHLKFIIRNAPSYMAVGMDQHNLLRWLESFILFSKLDGTLDGLSTKYLGRSLEQLPTH